MAKGEQFFYVPVVKNETAAKKSGYYKSLCCVCGEKAIYYKGQKAYCRDHKSHAVRKVYEDF